MRCSVCKHVFQLSDGVKPAEIRMEPDLSLSSPSLSMPPKKKGGIWGWVLTLLILCAVAGGTWWAWDLHAALRHREGDDRAAQEAGPGGAG